MASFQPTVVIGIGGTGKNVLLSLKKMIVENSKRGMKDYPVLRLFSLDTDVRIDSVSSEIKTIGDEIKLDPNTEMFSLGADGITGTLDLDSFPEIKSWYPYSRRAQLNPNNLSGGASQMKPVGRFSFAWNADALYQKIYQLLNNIVTTRTGAENNIGRSNLEQSINVFICGSVCGGTGSGTFMDLAYLVRFIAKQIGTIVNIYGMFALASIYDGIQGDLNLKPNCYASLVELDNFMNVDNCQSEKRRFYPAYRNISEETWAGYKEAANSRPFDYPYFFDRTNENGISFSSPKEFADMVARFICLLTGSEVASKWQSMDNNTKENLGNDIKLGKPIAYRGMGAFALLYPKRKIIQTCGYKFVSEYLKVILDDSYVEYNIKDTILKEFLIKNDLNYNDDSFYNHFNEFIDEGDTRTYSSIINIKVSSTKQDSIERADAQKDDFITSIRDQLEDTLSRKFSEFKKQKNSSVKSVCDSIINKIDNKIAEFLDLRNIEDIYNSNSDGSKIYSRGSIVRANKFLKYLEEHLRDAKKEFMNAEKNIREKIKNFESEYNTKTAELTEIVNKFSLKKTAVEKAEQTIDALKDLYTEKFNECVIAWLVQLLDQITVNGVPVSDGLLKEVELRVQYTNALIQKFENIQKEVDNFLLKSKSGYANNFCETIYDYKKDVDGIWLKETEGDKLDYYYEALGSFLKDKFGKYYEIAGKDLAEPRILRILLEKAEENFFDPISNVSIADRLMENPEKLNNFVSGTYEANSSVYLKLNGEELSKAGIATNGKVFYAISIPNEPEYDVHCKDLRSSQVGQKFKCPYEDGGANEGADEKCPRYNNGKCLKRIILSGASTDLTLLPSENKSEINILKTVAGFPARAVTTVAGPYRDEYNNAIKKQKQENDAAGISEERLHMFGPIKFTDLLEKAKSPKELEEEFKEILILGIAFKRIFVEKYAVKFLTQEDLMSGKDTPSMELGKSLEEIASLAQSTKFKDIEIINEVIKSVNYDFNDYKDPDVSTPEAKDKLFRWLKRGYDESAEKKLLSSDELKIFDKLTQKYCGKKIINDVILETTEERMNRLEGGNRSQIIESTKEVMYHLAVNGKDLGEFSLAQLKEKYVTKEFDKQSYVWTNGMVEWKKAEEVDGLKDIFISLPPVPPPLPSVPPVPPMA